MIAAFPALEKIEINLRKTPFPYDDKTGEKKNKILQEEKGFDEEKLLLEEDMEKNEKKKLEIMMYKTYLE